VTENSPERDLDRPAEGIPGAEAVSLLTGKEGRETESDPAAAGQADEGVSVEPAVPGDASPEGEEFGITLSDDELWDTGTGLDDIPLFEEFASEFEEQQVIHQTGGETGEAAQPGAAISHEKKPDEEPAETASSDTAQADAGRAEATVVNADTWGMPVWTPWAVTGISSVLSLAALVFIWGLAAGLPDPSRTGAGYGVGAGMSEPSGQAQEPGIAGGRNPGGQKILTQFETMSLAPFLIPGQRGGELVFFKLQVELVAPDVTTKHGLLKKEAWVRDAIYRELKGIDISPGVQGDFLQQYRRPIRERLNREMAPLGVEDVRLTGYLLQ